MKTIASEILSDGSTPPPYITQSDFVYRNRALRIASASGCTVVDVEGRRYVDAEAANGSAALGYDESILNDAVSAMRGLPMAPCFVETEVRLRVAEQLSISLNRAADGLGRVAFELGGAQAVELAVKVARAYRECDTFVVFEGGYHGRSIATSMLSASARYRWIAGQYGPHCVRLPYPDCEQCRFGQSRPSCAHECGTFARTLLSAEFAGVASGQRADVAGFIFEPLLNAGGMVLPDPEYVHSVVEAVRARGGLIIVDEIFSGFYRTGYEWGFQRYNIQPDIVIFSKALTNGIIPLSGIWCREPLLSPGFFPPGSHSVTFGNGVLALNVAEQVLRRFASLDMANRVKMLERKLEQVIEFAVEGSTRVKSWHVQGASARILLREPEASAIAASALQVAHGKGDDRFHGAIVAASALAPNALMLKPPFVISDSELDAVAEILRQVLRA